MIVLLDGLLPRRTRRARKRQPAVDHQTPLRVPRQRQPLLGHGLLLWRRSAHSSLQIWPLVRRHGQILLGRDRARHRLTTQTRLCASRHKTRQHPTGRKRPHTLGRLRLLPKNAARRHCSVKCGRRHARLHIARDIARHGRKPGPLRTRMRLVESGHCHVWNAVRRDAFLCRVSSGHLRQDHESRE